MNWKQLEWYERFSVAVLAIMVLVLPVILGCPVKGNISSGSGDQKESPWKVLHSGTLVGSEVLGVEADKVLFEFEDGTTYLIEEWRLWGRGISEWKIGVECDLLRWERRTGGGSDISRYALMVRQPERNNP